MRRPFALAAAVLTLAAPAVAGCGSESDGNDRAPDRAQPQPLQQAAASTKAAGSARVAVRATVSAAGRSLPVTGRGAVDLDRGVAQLRLGTQLPAAGRVDADTLLAGQSVYLRTGGLTSFLGAGKEWVKIDLARAAKQRGADLGLLKALGAGGKPSEYLAWLAVAGGAKEVGRERIGGVDTTHYRGRVDVKRLAASADPAVRRSVEQIGVRSIPVEAWIDAQGLVRRERVQLTTDKAPTPVALDLTLDLSDYGTKVDATPPADDDVFDATSFAASALKLLG